MLIPLVSNSIPGGPQLCSLAQITPAWRFLVILKSLISRIRCVWLGMELWPSRNWVGDQCLIWFISTETNQTSLIFVAWFVVLYQLKTKHTWVYLLTRIMTTVSVLMLTVLTSCSATSAPRQRHTDQIILRVIGVRLSRAAVTCLILDSVIRGDAQHIQPFKSFLSSHGHTVLTAESIPHRQTSGPGSGTELV